MLIRLVWYITKSVRVIQYGYVFLNLIQRIQEENRTGKSQNVGHSEKTEGNRENCQLLGTEQQKVS